MYLGPHALVSFPPYSNAFGWHEQYDQQKVGYIWEMTLLYFNKLSTINKFSAKKLRRDFKKLCIEKVSPNACTTIF
jgi:hypothetical protein